ncbi:MAG: thioredoxin family protein [Bacilli bacterium]
MEIKIVGKNCSNRNKLFKNLGKSLEDVKTKVEIELLEDKKYEDKYNVSNTPALVINDKVVSQGKVLNEREIKNFIRILT